MVVHLQSVDLFAYCTAEQMVRMASIATVRTFSAGECLYAARDSAESLFCLVEGAVELRSPSHREGVASERPNVDSDPSVHRRVEPPGTFGAREILGDEPRRWSAIAVTDGLSLCFDADDLFDLLSNNIEIVKALFRQLLRSPDPGTATFAAVVEKVAPLAAEPAGSPRPPAETGAGAGSSE